LRPLEGGIVGHGDRGRLSIAAVTTRLFRALDGLQNVRENRLALLVKVAHRQIAAAGGRVAATRGRHRLTCLRLRVIGLVLAPQLTLLDLRHHTLEVKAEPERCWKLLVRVLLLPGRPASRSVSPAEEWVLVHVVDYSIDYVVYCKFVELVASPFGDNFSGT